jgi:hypothetical protein
LRAKAEAIDFADDLTASARQTQSNDGTVTLAWRPPDQGVTVDLQQSRTPSFTAPITRYTGSDPGSVLTGLSEGDHFFRLRLHPASGPPGPWSEPLTVRVSFMDRGRLTLLLTLGGTVVALTVGAILTGHFRTRTGS